ncbi:MAG TPA: c-type cytochrome [Bryobacteraceae bacterium]|jgi:mono/diheme cytochrome c family protein
MGYHSRLAAVALLAGAAAACGSGRHSAAAFRLPRDGDVQRGQAAFVALGCNKCHEVSGVDLPRPTVQPTVPVVLGGAVDAKLSDAYLATSIIDPSYELAPYSKDQILSGGESRMPHYADQVTVRQLTDIVAFLQSRYVVPRLPPNYR